VTEEELARRRGVDGAPAGGRLRLGPASAPTTSSRPTPVPTWTSSSAPAVTTSPTTCI